MFARRAFPALFLAAGILAAISSVALATVPSTLSYQGVLTDNVGHLVPDGPYNLTFQVYNVGSGGVALWTENQNPVTVNKGGFSVVLGSVTPLNISFDQQLYLGISVNGGAELAPRVVLTPAPQALALRLPYAAAVTTSQPALTLTNWAGSGIFVQPSIFCGSSLDGSIAVGGPAHPYAMATMQSNEIGGYFNWWSVATGARVGEIYASPNTNGGQFDMSKGDGGLTVRLMGDATTLGDPALYLLGSSRSIVLHTAGVGDASVSLPANAISAGEILNEPGIAQGHSGGYFPIASGIPMTDIMSVTITTPAAGYIVVAADGMHGVGGDGSSTNEASFTIKETSGGDIDYSNYYVSGFNGAAPSALFRVAVSMRRTFFKAAGTYTFYFQASANNPSALSNYIWDPTVTATYYPTSYGTVTALASRGEAAREGLDGQSVRAAAGPGREHVSGDAVQVDLSVLELRAAKLREAALDAELQAMKARTVKTAEAKRVAMPAAAQAVQK